MHYPCDTFTKFESNIFIVFSLAVFSLLRNDQSHHLDWRASKSVRHQDL